MDVTGKILLFPKMVGKKDKIQIFETTIARKTQEGYYVDNYTIRVQFTKELLSYEKAKKFKEGNVYSIEIEGFLSTRSYDTKDGVHRVEPLLIVTKAKLLDAGREIKKPSEAIEDDALPL